MTKVIVNNDETFLNKGNSISDLITQLGLSSGKGIAVAVNNMVVPKVDWSQHELKQDDRVTLIKATQGG